MGSGIGSQNTGDIDQEYWEYGSECYRVLDHLWCPIENSRKTIGVFVVVVVVVVV